MAQNVIQNRAKSFLELYPPFMDLEDTVLQYLASEIEILFFKKDELVFHENEEPHPAFYIIRKVQLSFLFELTIFVESNSNIFFIE